jgi:hypothetical protein
MMRHKSDIHQSAAASTNERPTINQRADSGVWNLALGLNCRVSIASSLEFIFVDRTSFATFGGAGPSVQARAQVHDFGGFFLTRQHVVEIFLLLGQQLIAINKNRSSFSHSVTSLAKNFSSHDITFFIKRNPLPVRREGVFARRLS